jgi:raffinose/stachyose/melibiose transport system substrate-binding protein
VGSRNLLRANGYPPRPRQGEIWREAAQKFESSHPGVKVEFDHYLENEAFKAGPGLFIPAVKGTAEVIQEPLLKQIAQEIDRTQWIQIAMDQLLGPDTGRVLNDISADLSSGKTTPEKAAKTLESSWQQNKS